MRFFITLALVMLPMTAMQLYSADSFAFTNKSVQQKSLSDQVISTKVHAPVAEVSTDKTLTTKTTVSQDDGKQAKAEMKRSLKLRKERTKGKRKSAQGMQLLSVLLMLQDKKR